MKNFIIVIWLVFAAFFVFPICTNYITGEPASEIVSIIEKEAEADNIQIIGSEEKGNRSLFAFSAGDDIGVAVFSHFADNYHYEEGMMMLSGEEHIDVNMDTGWDMYRYRVTSDGISQMDFEKWGGTYKVYAILAAIMFVFSVAGGIYSLKIKKKHEEQRRKGLRQ